MLPRVRRGLKKDAMGRRRLVNSRSRRLEATHWRHSKYAANFTDGPADVGQGEGGCVPVAMHLLSAEASGRQ
jgi:hypothetical protein